MANTKDTNKGVKLINQISYNFNAEKATKQCIEWIKNWFKENGEDCYAVIGISGGADSTIAAKLCCEALGPHRVFGVLMPNGQQSDIKDSIKVCELLDIQSITVNIHKACKALKKEIKPALNDNWSKQTSINLPPRVRMTTLYAVSQTVKGRVVNTCNLSEDWVGYSTRYGDSVGDFSPLSNLTKTEVKAIGDYLGLPTSLVHKIPSDGLCGKTDEDNLGFTYAELDDYIRKGIPPTPEKKEKIDTLHERNLFKLQLMPSFKYEP